MTITEFARRYELGEITSEKVVLHYLEKISSLNEEYRAVLEINPDALFIARSLDEEAKNGKIRGPLHGVPVLIKGNIDTADKMETNGGALAFKGNHAKRDAFLVEKLRRAGAVILGKANLTELANFVSFKMPNGYSYLGGQTRNAHGDYDPGGSSSGSAVAVALDMCIASVGTETSGSIISPASSNAVVGHKPTVGTISRSGIIPISWTQDTAGPMAKTVEDAFSLFKAMIGYDEKDPATGISRWYEPSFKRIDSFHGLRFAVLENVISDIEDDVSRVFEKALKDVEKLGGKIERVKFKDIEMVNNIEVLFYEFPKALENYLKDKDISIKSLDDLIRFNLSHKEAIPYGQSILLKSSAYDINDPNYVRYLGRDRRIAKGGLDEILSKFDAILFPSNFGIHIPAKAGYPSITVPAGFSKSGPVGLTFTAGFLEDEKLYSLADIYFEKTRMKA